MILELTLSVRKKSVLIQFWLYKDLSGLITELKDVSSYRLDDEGVGMTKVLDIDPSTLTQFKTLM